MAGKERLVNVHPGEIIREDFLAPYRMTAYRLAKGMGVPPSRVLDILKGRRAITADTALRLSRFVGCSADFWLGLQASYDLREAEQDAAQELAAIERYQHEGPIWLDGEPHPPQKPMEELLRDHAAAVAKKAPRGARDRSRRATPV